jgi:hypothetical protein
MPATFDWESDHGVATGSPAQGTTRATGRTETNWKNADDATTANTAAPISAGNNSYTIYMFGKFSGTYTQIQNGLWAHTSGTFGTGITLDGVVTSTYATPSTTTNASLTVNMTSTISIGSGQTVLFSSVGPQGASPSSSTTANPAYTQYLASQLQTTGSVAAGLTATATMSLQYLEN